MLSVYLKVHSSAESNTDTRLTRLTS